MKKLTQLAGALLVSTTAFNAAALTFLFDPEQDNTFIEVDVLTSNMFPNNPTVVSQFFGADRMLNNGDMFTESFSYNNSTSTGSPSVNFGGDITFDITLSGSIGNVVYGAGVPDLADFDAGGAQQGQFYNNLDNTSFQTSFNTSLVDPTAGMEIKYMGTTIGMFDVIAQVNTVGISLDGTTVNQAFILDFGFNQTWAAANSALVNNVWRNVGMSLVDTSSFILQAKGSAGPNGTLDSNTGGGSGINSNSGADTSAEFAGINVQDNGATFTRQVPEPTTLAILGLGLLGLAGTRRRKS